jgi:hypothetical protein
MVKGLQLELEPPADGWVTVRLTAPDPTLELDASYTPRDSIGDLAQAASALVAGVPKQVVTWNTEPVEYDFCFSSTGGRTRLEVRQFPNHRRQRGRDGALVAVAEDVTGTLVRAVWRALWRLQGAVSAEAYVRSWRHPFPTGTVERLGAQIKALAAQQSR